MCLFDLISWNLFEVTEENRYKLVRTLDIRDDIWTQNLQNTRQECLLCKGWRPVYDNRFVYFGKIKLNLFRWTPWRPGVSRDMTPLVPNPDCIRTLSASHSGRCIPDTHWIGDWVWPGASLDASVYRKICYPCQEWNQDSSVTQPVAWSLHTLRSPVPHIRDDQSNFRARKCMQWL
jgi:hypothetical protein